MAIFLERQKGTNAFNTAALNHKEVLMAAWPMKAAAEELETMVRQGIEPTCLEDAEYPNRLYQCQDAQYSYFLKDLESGICLISLALWAHAITPFMQIKSFKNC